MQHEHSTHPPVGHACSPEAEPRLAAIQKTEQGAQDAPAGSWRGTPTRYVARVPKSCGASAESTESTTGGQCCCHRRCPKRLRRSALGRGMQAAGGNRQPRREYQGWPRGDCRGRVSAVSVGARAVISSGACSPAIHNCRLHTACVAPRRTCPSSNRRGSHGSGRAALGLGAWVGCAFHRERALLLRVVAVAVSARRSLWGCFETQCDDDGSASSARTHIQPRAHLVGMLDSCRADVESRPRYPHPRVQPARGDKVGKRVVYLWLQMVTTVGNMLFASEEAGHA